MRKCLHKKLLKRMLFGLHQLHRHLYWLLVRRLLHRMLQRLYQLHWQLFRQLRLWLFRRVLLVVQRLVFGQLRVRLCKRM